MNNEEFIKENVDLQMNAGDFGILGNVHKIWYVLFWGAAGILALLSATIGDGSALRALMCLSCIIFSRDCFVKYQLEKSKIYLAGIIFLGFLAIVSFGDFIYLSLR